MALHVYDSLMSCGKNYGLRNAGYYALRTLRTEKFFSYWGTDLLPQDTPLECGREFRVKFDVSVCTVRGHNCYCNHHINPNICQWLVGAI